MYILYPGIDGNFLSKAICKISHIKIDDGDGFGERTYWFHIDKIIIKTHNCNITKGSFRVSFNPLKYKIGNKKDFIKEVFNFTRNKYND